MNSDQDSSDQPAQPPGSFYPLQPLMAQTLAPLRAEDGAPPSVDAPAAESWRRAIFPPKTFQDLQWPRLLGMLEREAQTPQGRAILANLRPLPTRAGIERRLAETGEALRLLADDDLPPLMGLRDIQRALDHVTRQGVLLGEDLAAIARNCDVGARNYRFFDSRAGRFSLLAEVGAQIDPLDALRAELHASVDPGGELTDGASPELRRLRRNVQNQHDRLRSRIEQELAREDLVDHLQDDYFTVREQRYVLPIRAGARSQVPGVVHGYSSSGQTAFIEPSELVNLNNELRWAEAELQEEINRILARLSGQVAQHARSLQHNSDCLAYIDVVMAKARFSQRIRASVPRISETRVELKQLRHPLLYVQHLRDNAKDDIVANDLILEDDRRILLISGPNTGGKTVLLKAFGLCALMLHFGLPLPVAEGSTIPLYDSIFSDIGDEQSIEHDLSTFSSHLKNINAFLGECGPRSLVLLDELFTGTDPTQGAALAIALLEELARRGSSAAVTTHLENLKTLAIQNPAFANASMGFDLETLSPTYRLTLGIPGSSFALRISRRLGLPQPLIDRAMQVLDGQQHHHVDEVLATLEEQLSGLDAERNRLEHARREAQQKKRRFEKKYQDLLEKERGAIHADARALKKELHQARELIRQQIKALQQASVGGGAARLDQKQLSEFQDKLRDTEAVIDRANERTRPAKVSPSGYIEVPADEVEEGLEIYVHSFNRMGTVMAFDARSRRVQVQLGVLKVTVDLDDLFYPSEAQRQAHLRGESPGKTGRGARSGGGAEPAQAPHESHSGAPGEDLAIPQVPDNTVDLRGLRVDSGLEKLDLFLDHAYARGEVGVHIIHGHGTGALKRAVRGHLIDSRYVKEFRRGARNEGGDGVTVAVLAAKLR